MLNNSQLFDKNRKLYEKLDIYKRILNKKIENISKKNKNNSFKSYGNNSIFISSERKKNNCHSHSLENDFYSAYSKKKNNAIHNKLRGIKIKVIKGRNKNGKTSLDKNTINCVKQNVLDKKHDIFNSNLNSKNKQILINKINDKSLRKGDIDNSLRNFFFNKKDNNKNKKINNKMFSNFRQTSNKKKS